MSTYCLPRLEDYDQEKYDEPMVWIGIYVAIASLLCILAMATDLLYVITVAMKLPVDLSSDMPGYMDQAAKLGSLAFMCTVMANFMPSLAAMDNKTLLANIIGGDDLAMVGCGGWGGVVGGGGVGGGEVGEGGGGGDDLAMVGCGGWGGGRVGWGVWRRWWRRSGNGGVVGWGRVEWVRVGWVATILRWWGVVGGVGVGWGGVGGIGGGVCGDGGGGDRAMAAWWGVVGGWGGWWRGVVPLKVNVFVWKLLQNRIPSRDNLNRRGMYNEPMVWIGIYVAIASLICILAMAADLLHGYVDQVAKLRSLAFMCSMMTNFMPSLAAMDNKTLLTNVIVSIVDKLREHVRRYWIMAETGSPQFVMSRNPLCTASGVICMIVLGLNLLVVIDFPFGGHAYGSVYKWSVLFIVITQFIGVLVGTMALIFRCFLVLRFKKVIEWNNTHLMVFKVEEYWTQKLREWKQSPIRFLSSSRSRTIVYNMKSIIISLCIRLQKVIVILCKVISIIPTIISIFVIVYCLYCWKSLKARLLTPPTVSRTDDTEVDLSNYILQIHDEMELAEKTLKCITNSMNSFILKAEKEQNKDLLELLEKTTRFKVVENFDNDTVQPLLSVELVNSWSLPIVTLTCIAVALPNIHKDTIKSLLRSIGEELKKLRDKSMEVSVENIPKELIAANSMYRIAETILLRDESNTEQINEEQLFSLLNGMIADIFSACFTNLPRVITVKCNESVIEKRESSVKAAATLLGKTTKIIERLETWELPSMDPGKMSYVDEWRLYLKQSIP
ncbi:hypothetical protein L1987_31718 [Smallanthus sonchifolius]|uniref:Uncharacterized protein n=1 Tax=Smallanthus sonchifolius TaxID=185202 RepID=A0ACB9I921_9ASTR|nr:hypothetical protein L1987_31718 [Smallanthus sonchifolius]